MIKFYIFLLLFVLVKPSFSQTPSQTIRGQILDKESRAGIPGANIIVTGTDPLKGTVSDDR
ncbi:hypothetical protein BH23BAC1_BH23BAC1_05500 [soil metagenome]